MCEAVGTREWAEYARRWDSRRSRRGQRVLAVVRGAAHLRCKLTTERRQCEGQLALAKGLLDALLPTEGCVQLWDAADALEVALLTFLSPCAKEAFGADYAMESSLISVVFAGEFAGAVFWGLLADRYGRRVAYFWAMVTVCVPGLLSACAPDFATLLALPGVRRAAHRLELPRAHDLALRAAELRRGVEAGEVVDDRLRERVGRDLKEAIAQAEAWKEPVAPL